jgi:DNA-binding NarL/FixJ family response regulator
MSSPRSKCGFRVGEARVGDIVELRHIRLRTAQIGDVGAHLVIEGSEQAFRHAAAAATGGTRFTVRDEADAHAAVLAAVGGARVVVHGLAARDLLDRLIDDLRRLGRVEHRIGEPAPDPLSADERALLQLLAQGRSLGEAARQLAISRRTADRRLSAARAALGVATTAEAVARASS